ncbi:hypothetical protein SETIT_8G234400v2 [Setaria italica]|uniref:Uncharacterized protein n=1 Tax=Setaria italica TaxID=4555 RepID=A0A368SAU1_SETIT|nr:hypothetical protein SETIT_8G234400v2 [Setaria italica]
MGDLVFIFVASLEGNTASGGIARRTSSWKAPLSITEKIFVAAPPTSRQHTSTWWSPATSRQIAVPDGRSGDAVASKERAEPTRVAGGSHPERVLTHSGRASRRYGERFHPWSASSNV